MASLFPKGFRWDDSDDEPEAIPYAVIIRDNNDGGSLTVTNQTDKNLKVLISLDNKLIKFGINKASNRVCYFNCDPSKVFVDGRSIADSGIFLSLGSKALIDDDVADQPIVESPMTSDVASSAGGSVNSKNAVKMQLAKLIMMAESRKYDFKYYVIDEAGRPIANNLFD